VRALRAQFASVPIAELVLRLTALVAIVYAAQSEVLEAFFVVIAGAGLVAPALLRRSRFWVTLLVLSAVFHGLKWSSIDNHKVLFAYWLLAVALAIKTATVSESLGRAGRLLIGACFACGLFWKLFGGEYLNGSFLTFSLLVNTKFLPLTEAFSGLTSAQISQFTGDVGLLRAGVLRPEALVIPVTERLSMMALAASYFTLAIEGAIALAFLLGDRLGSVARHALLLLFIFVVYPIATVPGFACILVVMGLADLKAHQTRLRELYLLAFALSALSFIPKTVPVYLTMLSDFLAW
jgi:hypothetical protein